MAGGRQRPEKVIGAINIGSFRVSAMIAAVSEGGQIRILGSGNRASNGIRRGLVIDMAAATHAVRDALEKAERMAGASVDKVWIGACGTGLSSEIRQIERIIGGRRIEQEDIELLLHDAKAMLAGDGGRVLHAEAAAYFLDGAHGVAHPQGLYADRLGVEVLVMMAEGAPIRNLREAVERAHLHVQGVVAAPLATGIACLSPEERELGAALVELGADVTTVAVHEGGMLRGLACIGRGSGDITDAIASAFNVRRFEAERLKCKHGTAIASRSDHREIIPITAAAQSGMAGGDGAAGVAIAGGGLAGGGRGEVIRADLVSVITRELAGLMDDVGRHLVAMGFAHGGDGPGNRAGSGAGSGAGVGREQAGRARQVVITGGGAELAGLADYAQSVLGLPVRIGRPPPLAGLPEAHTTPGFATLAGIVCHAAAGRPDIRARHSRFGPPGPGGKGALFERIWHAMREFF